VVVLSRGGGGGGIRDEELALGAVRETDACDAADTDGKGGFTNPSVCDGPGDFFSASASPSSKLNVGMSAAGGAATAVAFGVVCAVPVSLSSSSPGGEETGSDVVVLEVTSSFTSFSASAEAGRLCGFDPDRDTRAQSPSAQAQAQVFGGHRYSRQHAVAMRAPTPTQPMPGCAVQKICWEHGDNEGEKRCMKER